MHFATDFMARAWSAAGWHTRRESSVSRDEHACPACAALTPGATIRCSLPRSTPHRVAIALHAAMSGVEGSWVDQAFRGIEGFEP